MSKRDLITHDYLLSILDYNPDTGIFVWRPRTPDMFKDGKHTKEHTCAKWNSRCAGKKAGSKDSNNAIHINIFYKVYYAHIMAWFYVYKSWPKSQLDHIDNDTTNNSIKNLREATTKQNCANKKKYETNSSGYKGVYYDKNMGRYTAQITFNYKKIHLGCFDDPEEAHEAYCKAAKKLHGEFARFE